MNQEISLLNLAQSQSFFLIFFFFFRTYRGLCFLVFQEEWSLETFSHFFFVFICKPVVYLENIVLVIQEINNFPSVCFHFLYAWSVIFRLCCFLLVTLWFAGERGKRLSHFIMYFSSIISALLHLYNSCLICFMLYSLRILREYFNIFFLKHIYCIVVITL